VNLETNSRKVALVIKIVIREQKFPFTLSVALSHFH